MNRYFTSKNGVQGGPYTEDEVKALLRSGTIGMNDLFRKEGSETWLPATDFQGGAAAPPPSGAVVSPRKSNGGRRTAAVVIALLLLLIGGCVFVRSCSRSKSAETTGGPGPNPTGQGATPGTSAVRPTPTPPNYETWFISSVSRFESSTPPGSTQATIDHNREERWLGIERAFPGMRSLNGWVGTLRKAEKTIDGRLAVVIELPGSNILVQSWNDPAADAGAGTLIDSKSEDYQRLRALRPGAAVTFDVEFLESKEDWIKEGSKDVFEGFRAPKFIARIKNVKGG